MIRLIFFGTVLNGILLDKYDYQPTLFHHLLPGPTPTRQAGEDVVGSVDVVGAGLGDAFWGKADGWKHSCGG